MSRMLMGLSLNSWILSITPLFLVAFSALVFWVYHRSRKSHYEQVGRLPLELMEEEANVTK